LLTTRISDFNMLTYSNSNSVMEPDTISKNGASRKSHASRVNLLVVLVCAMMAFFYSSCSSTAKITNGSITYLKGQEKVHVVLDFGETLDEINRLEGTTEGYADEERALLLSERDEQLRNEAYKLLIEKMDNVVKRKRLSVGNYPNAEYTIYVKVIKFNPGIPMKVNSAVTADVSFVKKGETHPFATATCFSLGKYSIYVGPWVARAALPFGYLGDNIGKVIIKNLK